MPVRNPVLVAKNEHNEIEDETTPLLPSQCSAPVRDTADAEAPSSTTEDDRPLPMGQILLLCYAQLLEPIAFFYLFPFISRMVQRNGHLRDADVGFYTGLIESLFSLTQMFTMPIWGRMSDRYGRKPVLVGSLAGLSLGSTLFGFSQTVWQMILLRCFSGVFGGVLVTIRTIFNDLSTSKTQARAFSWLAFARNVGMFFGPCIGGALSEPTVQFPGVFGRSGLLQRYPYALPALFTGALGITATVVSAVFVQESLELAKQKALSSGKSPISTRDLLKNRSVQKVLYLYSHGMFLGFAYTAIVPVFLFTPVDLGGYGLSNLASSVFMAITGIAQAIWLLVMFPPLQRRLGTGGVLRGCGNVYPFLFIGCPLFNLLLRNGTKGSTIAFWVCGPIFLTLASGVSMAFTVVQLALNDVAPSPQVVGMLNALALSLVSGVRAFTPVLFTSIFAIGVKSQFANGYLVWFVLFAFAAAFTVGTRFLPKEAESKTDRN